MGLLTLPTAGEREQVGTWHETQAKQTCMHTCVCANQCNIGRLVCKSSCHNCPTLHRRTGPVAPPDNHSRAKSHRFGSHLSAYHRAILFNPLIYVCVATRLVYGNTRQALCMLHTEQQKPGCLYLAL